MSKTDRVLKHFKTFHKGPANSLKSIFLFTLKSYHYEHD